MACHHLLWCLYLVTRPRFHLCSTVPLQCYRNLQRAHGTTTATLSSTKTCKNLSSTTPQIPPTLADNLVTLHEMPIKQIFAVHFCHHHLTEPLITFADKLLFALHAINTRLANGPGTPTDTQLAAVQTLHTILHQYILHPQWATLPNLQE